eukprot:scaffold1489_cov201-Chaetoceros_neogracile.AAC.3
MICTSKKRREGQVLRNWNLQVLFILVITLVFLAHDEFLVPSLFSTAVDGPSTLAIHRVLFPSLFVRADGNLQQREKNAQFVLNARNRRRKLFESSILQHYSRNTTDASFASRDNMEQKRIKDYFMHQSDNEVRAGMPLNMTTTNLQIMEEISPVTFPPMPPSRISTNIEKVKSMFQHAYDSYMYHGYPGSELKPLSCKSGSFELVRLPALTLIDSLDMLLIMQNHTEFARSVERLRVLDQEFATNIKWDIHIRRGGIFAQNQNVSVFETNIRVLGGLLSAHQMAVAWMEEEVVMGDIFSEDGSVLMGEIIGSDEICSGPNWHGSKCKMPVCSDHKGVDVCTQSSIVDPVTRGEDIHVEGKEKERRSNSTQANVTNTQFWVYDGFLLELAHDVGKRLIPAFNTLTGIPYGTVNLVYGVPVDETPIASLAGGGTLTIEMELLSRLTKDEIFGKLARLSTRALFSRRSDLNLLGKHIDVQEGSWTETMAGIGSNSDSIYEYLIKHHILFQEDEDFFAMFNTTYAGIHQNGKLGDWYPDVSMTNGLQQPNSVFESLAAFYPGMQILLGELNPAARSTDAFTMARESVKFLPERFDFAQFEAYYNHETYPLRPELYESNYFLHIATKDLGLSSTSGWLWNADFFMHELDAAAKTECGYATIKGITSQARKKNLTLYDEMPSYFLSETLKYLYLTFDSDNSIDTDKERNWIFTTEAHPLHTVPLEESWLDGAREDLLSTLDRMVDNNTTPTGAVPLKSNTTLSGKYFHREKWATLTGKFPHMKDLEKIRMKSLRAAYTPSGIDDSSGRCMHKPHMGIEIEPELVSTLNFAYLNHAKDGRGARITQSCPNYYQSNSLWIQALTGEETDYSQVVESTISNDFAVLSLKPKQPSALTASILFGTSYLSKDSEKCKSRNKYDSRDQSSWKAGTQRIDMGESGSFDIFVEPAGAGYFVKHVQSGESIEVTIVPAEPAVDGGEHFVAVDSYIITPDAGIKDKNSLLNQFKSALTFQPAHKRKKKRHVLVADMDGNSFECKVELKHVVDGLDVMNELGGFPCLPASYGATAISALVLGDGKGVSYEAKLYKPDVIDPFGCHEDWERAQLCDETVDTDAEENFRRVSEAREKLMVLKKLKKPSEFALKEMEKTENVISNIEETIKLAERSCLIEDPRVQLTERGMCNFRSKGLNLKNRFNAEACVVVNSDPKGLFIMAGPMTTSQKMSNVEEPITVLVTGEDGDQMKRIVDQYTIEGKEIIAKVKITPRSGMDASVNVKSTPVGEANSLRWPIVNTAANRVQIYASQNWGVGAIKEGNTWNIILLQHSANN